MRPVLTARVTLIEAFRQFLYCEDNEDTPWINEPNVINTVRGIESSNVKADFGTSGHNIIENALMYKTDTGYKVKDFVFTDAQAWPLIKYRNKYPLMVREVCVSKVYRLRSCDLIITGHIDGLNGTHVHDNKFKFSSFDALDFIESYQWRMYLDMIGLDTFVYDFFNVTGFSEMADCPKAKISDCESMVVKRYPEMQQEIYSMLEEFMDWITFKGLEQYLAIDKNKAKKILAGDPSLRNLIAI